MSEKTFVKNGFVVRLPDEPLMQIEDDVNTTDDDPPISVEDAFKEMVTEKPIDKSMPLVVLDGANIGWAYGDTSFSARGLRIALDNFSKFRLNVVAFIPSAFLRRRPRDGSKGNACMETDDWTELHSLVKSGDVAVVPAGDHDDVYILHYARTNNGFVVSNDFYADHIKKICDESIRKSMTLWLAENRSGYTFLRGSFLLNPASPLGSLLTEADRGSLKGGAADAALSRPPSMRLLAPTSEHPTSSSALGSTAAAVISSLTATINVLLAATRPVELKYVLIARAHAYMDLGMREESFSDLKFILEQLDPHFPEAVAMIAAISSMTSALS